MKWLEGKKTWIGAALLVLAALWGYWHGVLDATVATLIIGAALSIIGVADKFQRYIPLLLNALDKMREAQEKAAKEKQPSLARAVNELHTSPPDAPAPNPFVERRAPR